jgi:hypothetical protein
MCWWLTPVSLATQEVVEIRRIVVLSQSRQIVLKTLAQKYLTLRRAGGVAQGVGPEVKPPYCKKKKSIYLSIYLSISFCFSCLFIYFTLKS